MAHPIETLIHALAVLTRAAFESTARALRAPADLQTAPHSVVERDGAWTEIGTAPFAPPAPVVREGARLVHAFDAVETDATRLLAAAERLRFTAASARAERHG